MMANRELPTRPSLVERLRDREDRESWREFFDRYWRLIYGLAIKSGLSEGEAEEVVQETMASIARGLDNYEYKPRECSFKSWMFRMAKWRIIDQIRKRPPQFIQSAPMGRSADRTATVERVADGAPAALDQIWEAEWEQNQLQTALSRVKQKVSIKQFQIFDLYVLKGWRLEEIKRLLHVSAASVYVAKHRISALLRKEVQRLEEENEHEG